MVLSVRERLLGLLLLKALKILFMKLTIYVISYIYVNVFKYSKFLQVLVCTYCAGGGISLPTATLLNYNLINSLYTGSLPQQPYIDSLHDIDVLKFPPLPQH